MRSAFIILKEGDGRPCAAFSFFLLFFHLVCERRYYNKSAARLGGAFSFFSKYLIILGVLIAVNASAVVVKEALDAALCERDAMRIFADEAAGFVSDVTHVVNTLRF